MTEITDEMVETACTAYFLGFGIESWGMVPVGNKPQFRNAMRAALTAVAPLMQGVPVAWLRDDGAQAGSETSVITNRIRELWLQCNDQLVERYTIPLYRVPLPAAPEVQS
jgi:hypothetical protein